MNDNLHSLLHRCTELMCGFPHDYIWPVYVELHQARLTRAIQRGDVVWAEVWGTLLLRNLQVECKATGRKELHCG